MSTATAVAALTAGVLAVLILIALNAWFVAQEFAYRSVDRSHLAARALLNLVVSMLLGLMAVLFLLCGKNIMVKDAYFIHHWGMS